MYKKCIEKKLKKQLQKKCIDKNKRSNYRKNVQRMYLGKN